MKCPQCEQVVPSDAAFCPVCGRKLEGICAVCGTANDPSHRYCKKCGLGLGPEDPYASAQPTAPVAYTPKHLAERILTSRAALEGERKQVTVLFCDIVNSTPLAESLGAEGMHELLNAFFDVALTEIHRYEGTVNQFLGDGFMALFGAPIAHEDHARRAALAALDIRAALEHRRLDAASLGWRDCHVRMGLNSGSLVVGKIGNDLRMDYTAIGDTTNIASRIQSAAAPDEILLSDSTRRLVEGYIDLEKLPPVLVKGKREPLQLYKVVGVGKRRSLIDVVERTPFVGRSEDMAILSDALQRTQAGHGGVVEVEGDPGIGKSRLVHEFLSTLQSDGVVHVVGRCLSYGRSIPYLPILEALREYCGIEQGDEPTVVSSKLHHVVAETGRLAADDVPYLLHFLGIKEGTERVALLDPATIKGRMFEVLRASFIRRSSQRPLVLAIEDLHWVDASSLEFLAELVPDLAFAHVLLIATARPGFSAPWAASHASHIALRPLSQSDSAAVVDGVVGSTTLAPELTTLVMNKGEGNPFFLEELARALSERHERDRIVAVPDTVQGVLAARIDRLPEEDKRLLESASVLGREFPVSLLQAVWQGNAFALSRLSELARSDFLYQTHSVDESVYVFKHALTQEVAYESILTGRRRTLHRLAAEALESRYADRFEEACEVIAHHYSRSGETTKAIDFLEIANRKAIASQAMMEAKDFFSEALRLLETLPATNATLRRRVVLLLNQFPVFHLLHAHQEYYDLLTRYEPIVNALGDNSLRASFLVELGQRLATFAETRRAREVLSEAAALCDATGNVAQAAHAYTMLAWVNILTGDFEDVESLRALALERLRTRPVPAVSMLADAGASLAYAYAGRWRDAVRAAQDGYKRGEQLSDDGVMSFCDSFTSVAYVYQGDWSRAIQHAEAALAKAPTVYFRGWAQMYLAAAHCGSGKADPALDILASIVDFIRSSRHELGYLLSVTLLGTAYVAAGQYEKAKVYLEDLVARADTAGVRFTQGAARRLLAEVAMYSDPQQGRQTLAAGLFERSIEELRAIGAENELALALAGYGRLRQRAGDVVKARELFTEANQIFERLGTLHEPEKLARELATLGT